MEGVPVQVLLALHMLEMVELVVRAVVVVMEVLEVRVLLVKVMRVVPLQMVVLEVLVAAEVLALQVQMAVPALQRFWWRWLSFLYNWYFCNSCRRWRWRYLEQSSIH